jgi:hypothetical protein
LLRPELSLHASTFDSRSLAVFLNRAVRKKTFVNTAIQGRIITRMAVYWVLYHIVLWHGMFLYRYLQYRSDVLSGGDAVPFRELYGQFVIDYYPMAICAMIILPAFMLDFVRLTHRIAGPLVRFRHALNDMMAGQTVEKVDLRKGDLLSEFQEAFNEFLDFYNGKRNPAAATAPAAAHAVSTAAVAPPAAPAPATPAPAAAAHPAVPAPLTPATAPAPAPALHAAPARVATPAAVAPPQLTTAQAELVAAVVSTGEKALEPVGAAH